MYRLIIIALLVASCGDSGKEGFDPPENYQSRSGKAIFQIHCASCHGTDGKLGAAGAKDLTKSGMDSTAIVDIIRNGKNAMPRQIQYIETEEELTNTVNYIKSLQK